MPTSKDSIVINLLDSTQAMPVETYGEVIVVGPHTTNLNYNSVQKYTSQSAVETDFGAGSNIAKATAKVFAQGVSHVRVLNVYDGAAEQYATALAKLETDQEDYDIIAPTEAVDDANFGTLVTHATTYKKVLICPQVNKTAALTNTDMDALTKDESQYAIAYDDATYTVGELAGAVAGVISQKKSWISPEWANITGINAAGYSPDDVSTLEGNRVNTVITVGTATVLSSGMALKTGTWIDIMRTKQYLSNLIRNELINLKLRLANSNQKIPYTPMGLKQIQSTIERSCRLAQAAGALREDYVDGSGDLVKGYTVNMPVYEDISASDKSARLLQNITVTAYLSGAVSKISMDLILAL